MTGRTDRPDHPMAWWSDGWSRSRETGRPRWTDGVGRIEVGAARESVRWLLPRPTPTVLGDLLALPHPVHTSVMVSGEPSVWEDRFPEGWVPDVPVVLMTGPLGDLPVRLPAGYRLEVVDEEHRVLVRVRAEDGVVAASGQLGLGERHGVPDRVVTDADHRRRGLGTTVMAALGEAGRARGLRRGVLGATRDGSALYRRIGWREVGPRTGMYLRPPAQGAG